MDIDSLVKVYSSSMEKLIPFIRKQSKSSFIGLAVLLVLLERSYSFLAVPKNLRHFPRVSFLSMVKSFYMGEHVATRNKRLIEPIISAGNGFYINKIPAKWTLYVTNPFAAKALLLKTENFPKSHMFFDALGKTSPVVRFMGSDNVAVSNGAMWKKQRKIMNPAFHKAVPVKLFGSMLPRLFELIDQESDQVPVTERMKAFTLDVLGLAAFDFDFQSLKGDPDGWTKTYNVVIESLFDPWLNLFAKVDFLINYISPKRKRINKALSEFITKLDELTDLKKKELLQGGIKAGIPDGEKDLLTLMLEADMLENTSTSSEELRHNLAIFFLAGHDTTANTLSFCLYNLAKNKRVQDKAREEILRVLGDEPVDVFPSLEDLKQLTYLNMVMKENLRRDGPIDKLMMRDTLEDIDLAGTIIPKGTGISVDVSSIHMDASLWKDPEQFIPERFEQGGEHSQHEGFTYLPFSSGTRQCIGMNFSLTEQRVALSMILRKYEVDISKDSIHYDHIVYDKPVNFAPRNLKLKFTKRY